MSKKLDPERKVLQTVVSWNSSDQVRLHITDNKRKEEQFLLEIDEAVSLHAELGKQLMLFAITEAKRAIDRPWEDD